MHTKVVVDASVWVSWFISQDVNHHASFMWMEKYTFGKGEIEAPAILLVELSASISRQKGRSELAKETVRNLQSLSELHIIPMDTALVQAASDIAADPAITCRRCLVRRGSALIEHSSNQLGSRATTKSKYSY